MLRFPASYLQEWLFEASTSGFSDFNVPVLMRFTGPLDRVRLGESVAALAARHETLRTTLVWSTDGLRQEVSPAAAWQIEKRDLSTATGAARKRLFRMLDIELARPFRLERAPLVRAVLFTVGREEHVLLLVLHHAVSDGWSTGVVFEELIDLYRAGPDVTPDPLPLQFGDFAAWERGLDTSAIPALWRDGFRSPRLVLDLPGTSGSVPTYRTRPHPLPRLTPSVVRRLSVLAASRRTTLATVLGAGAVASLSDTVENEILVGAIVANRDRAELRPLIGFLANQLPVRVDLTGGPTFVDLIDRFDHALRTAYDAQVPIGLLRDTIRTRRPSGRPLFDMNFNFLPPAALPTQAILSASGRTVRVSLVEPARERFEHSVDQWWDGSAVVDFQPRIDDRGYLAGHLVANDHALERSVTTRIARRYIDLLRRACVHPESSLPGLVRAGRRTAVGAR